MMRCDAGGLTAGSALAYAPACQLALIMTLLDAFGLDLPT
jgi:hypothetical protein